MTKPTCPVCGGEMIWDISADAARYICLWSEKQPELHAQLAAAVAERDALRAALDSVLFHTGAKCPICDACPQYLDDDAPAVTHAPDCEAAVESAQAAD